MSLLIECPLPAAIPTLPNQDCPEHFSQIVRLIFFRYRTVTGALNSLTDITDEAVHDAALAAIDDGKIQYSPLCENVVIPQGEAVTEGEDSNESTFGNTQVLGKTTITITGRFRGLKADVKKELDKYLAEGAVYGNLGLFLVNEFGQILTDNPVSAPPVASPFPISAWFIGDPGSEGFNAHNFTPFQFSLRGGWADNLEFQTPAFDILTKPNP